VKVDRLDSINNSTGAPMSYRVNSHTIATSITAAVMTMASNMTASSFVFLRACGQSRLRIVDQ
jgi:hypothetical protein